MAVWVLTGRQASAGDTSAIRRGVSSRELMQMAGERAADLILRRFAHEATRGVAVFTGSGNNGGDGFIVARVLAQHGIPTEVSCVLAPRSDDARWAQRLFTEANARAPAEPLGNTPGLVVDAVLGTGSSGAPRDAASTAIQSMRELQQKGARLVALDLPSGVPSDGEASWTTPHANTTISFGSVKRGHLLNRVRCGDLCIVDIGLTDADLAGPDRLQLIVPDWVRSRIPPIAAQGHKGTRAKLVIVGGADGMVGAVALAARAALNSGIGLVHCCVHPLSLPAIQALVPAATASAWPATPGEGFAWEGWPDALLIGPGLGRGESRRALVAAALQLSTIPVVIDADGLTNFKDDTRTLATWLRARHSIITPHAGEAGALIGLPADTVMAERFSVAPSMASSFGTCVVLKGAPTIIATPHATARVSARGNAVLATGGSGDILGGIIATLLAQKCSPDHAASIGAFIHGRAAELLVEAGGNVRGVPIEAVIGALRSAWQQGVQAATPGELANLPALPDE